ncbi:sensor histidine kinase [Seonamhaeicola sp. ML3]|uniref:sensor histidine kinase n=1 Tax=Seonamhaeicola sp. ML3 TaxID=2937786 RepID=UPI0020101236|nr:histidine kinase [Seonamhaeicola sp. ML3]
MKNLFFLILVLVVIDVTMVSSNSESINEKIFNNELNEQKDPTWERIITQVYGRGISKSKTLLKYKGPVLFKLSGAVDKDSLAFDNTLQYFKGLLPHLEIDYFSNYISRHEISKDSMVNGYPIKHLNSFAIKFEINNSGTVSFGENPWYDVIDDETFVHFQSFSMSSNQKRMAGYINSLTRFNFFSNIINSSERAKLFKNVMFKILSAKSFHISDDYVNQNISESDELVLQKFYSPNFEQELKEYMNGVYGWRYANHFLDKDNYLKKVWLIICGIGLLFFILLFSVFHYKKFKYEYLNYFPPILLVTICASSLGRIYKHFTSFNSSMTWMDYMIEDILPSIIFSSLGALLLWFFEKRVIKKSWGLSVNLLFKVLFTFLVFNLPFLAYVIEGRTVSILTYHWSGFLLYGFLSIGRGILIYLNHYSQSLVNEKEVELSKLKQLHAQAETKLLQSQINPHFLYNSLNSIASLAPVDANKTQKMVYALSDLFNYSINRKGKKMSTVKDEIDMVTSYLDIEKIRFGDRLNFKIEVDKGLEHHEIPLFLIQPLVENAVKHGVSQNEGEGKINLSIKRTDNQLLISVGDNGPDFPEGLVSGHGLQTVYDLLRLSYGDRASLNWTNTPEKAITITLPETL